MHQKLFVLISFLSICFGAISQLQISKDSLLKQFENTAPEKHVFVKGNDLTTITCLDKKGNMRTVGVTNRTGIRITENDKSRITFYLNTVALTDSTITGSKTHFFNAPIKPVRFSDIQKIEILR